MEGLSAVASEHQELLGFVKMKIYDKKALAYFVQKQVRLSQNQSKTEFLTKKVFVTTLQTDSQK